MMRMRWTQHLAFTSSLVRQSHCHNDLERLLGSRLDPDYPISACPSQDLALDRPFDRVVG